MSREWRAAVLQQAEDAATRWRRAFLLVASVALLMAAALVVALPLARPYPVVVEVEESTGDIRVLSDLVAGERLARLTASTAIQEHEVVSYIELREGWLDETWDSRWRGIAERSTKQVFNDYRSLFDDSETNPRALYAGMIRHVDIRSVQPLDERVFQVRFRTRTGVPGREAQGTEAVWVAVVAFDFAVSETKELGRRWENPLGFVVTRYVLSKEVG